MVYNTQQIIFLHLTKRKVLLISSLCSFFSCEIESYRKSTRGRSTSFLNAIQRKPIAYIYIYIYIYLYIYTYLTIYLPIYIYIQKWGIPAPIARTLGIERTTNQFGNGSQLIRLYEEPRGAWLNGRHCTQGSFYDGVPISLLFSRDIADSPSFFSSFMHCVYI